MALDLSTIIYLAVGSVVVLGVGWAVVRRRRAREAARIQALMANARFRSGTPESSSGARLAQ